MYVCMVVKRTFEFSGVSWKGQQYNSEDKNGNCNLEFDDYQVIGITSNDDDQLFAITSEDDDQVFAITSEDAVRIADESVNYNRNEGPGAQIEYGFESQNSYIRYIRCRAVYVYNQHSSFVRIWSYLLLQSSSFKTHYFEHLTTPSAKHENSYFVKWNNE
ncbi:MAG: hypothetical protein EZS28_003536 [Streblomastix strix]|uniref:Uncharacterized protein n=1 Tax=Streblomastix strix TaxID=222440 RepID=A0A5J4X160_9EUKA|nr:MAG: hypothetical protein EZS28_003536 [Streblomastix strix]